jgi:hypothetical protein
VKKSTVAERSWAGRKAGDDGRFYDQLRLYQDSDLVVVRLDGEKQGNAVDWAIAMRFFKRKTLKRGGEEWRNAIAAYWRNWESILPFLPESAIALENHMKRYTFHDAWIEGIARQTHSELTIDLNDRRLEFDGVRNFTCSEEMTPTWLHDETPVWLYDEIDKAPQGGFELRVLLDQGELSVVAKEVRVYAKWLRRYIVPEEPPPALPTLFSDRGKGKRKKRKR